MLTPEEISKEIELIRARNKRVEADKAWETSITRRLMIAVVTYIIASVWLFTIHESLFWLKAFVPVAGYILSTLSLPIIKSRWTKSNFSINGD